MSGLDIFILVILFSGLWQGFQKGLLQSVVGLVGWLFALIFATYFAKPLSPLLSGFFDTPVLAVVASFVVVALFVIIGLQIILWVMSKTLKELKLSFLDKIAGAMFATAKNLMVILLVFSVISPFVQNTQTWQKSTIAPELLPFASFAVELSNKLLNDVKTQGDKGLQKLDSMAEKTNVQ